MQLRSLLALSLLAPLGGLAAQKPTKVTKDAPAAPATGAASASALPAAQAIIDRYVQAVGGRAALAKIQSLHAVGTFEMPAQGLKGDLDMNAARPNKVAMKISVPGMGDLLQGYDGAVGWSMNPMQGPRVLDGKELQQLVEEADFDNIFRGSTNVVSRETVEQTTMNGEPCYRVKTVRASGETFECYSVASGLLVATSSKRESAMGTIEATTLVSDYKAFGDVKLATRSRVQVPAMGAEQVITFSSVELDQPNAAAFARPAAIDSLAKQGKP